MPYFCSVHQPGTSAYKRAQPRRGAWEREKSAMLASYPLFDAPWQDYPAMPFRAWLEKWLPRVAERHPEGDAASLVAALDDGEAPAEARRRHHALVLESPKRLTAFLADVECWWIVDPTRGGAAAPPRG
jgi:hypothetical protein